MLETAHPILLRAAWQALSIDDLARAQDYARRMRQHRGRANARPMREDGQEDVMGKLGELAYGRTIGREPSWFINPVNDGGEDFPGINVRARGLSADALYPPQLLVPPEDLATHLATRVFVLVAVNLDDLKAAPLGWARRSEVEAAPIRDDIKHRAHAVKATWLHALPVEAL